MKKLLALLVFATAAFSQESVNGNRIFLGKVIAANSKETATAKIVTSLPTTCDNANRERVFLTSNNTEYICTATNTWSAVVMASTIGAQNGTAPLDGNSLVPVLNIPNLNLLNGKLNMAQLNAAGAASSSTYLRGDGYWAPVSGGSGGASGTSDNITYSQGATGAVTRTVTNKLQETVSVLDFGALNDAIMRSDGNISAASTTFSSGSGTFTSSDVGKYIEIIGAGANGMTLETRINSVQSTTSVTLANAASTTVNGSAVYAYGTNNNTFFQAAIDAVGAAGGGSVLIPGPKSCPSGATCGYIVADTDMQTGAFPSAIKIRNNNISLIGAANSNLFCRGAWKTYTNTTEFPGQTAEIRGNCINIGDTAASSLNNITISGLHLYGMTNGNTYNTSTSATSAPLSSTGDGWDQTNRAIYFYNNGTFDNVMLDNLTIQDFKGEGIYSGTGTAVTRAIIKNAKITNFNGDGINTASADIQILNSDISNGSNAGIETFTKGSTAGVGYTLVRQLIQGNKISTFPAEAITIGGSDQSTTYSGEVQILDNYIDNIGIVNGGSGQKIGIYLYALATDNPTDNVLIRGNLFHNCNDLFDEPSAELSTIYDNQVIEDTATPKNFVKFDYPFNNGPGTTNNENVAFSATPVFSTATTSSLITLTGNIIFSLGPGSDGQQKTLTFCQDATGNRTVTAPGNVRGFFTVGGTANTCSSQSFTYYNTPTAWIANNTGITNK